VRRHAQEALNSSATAPEVRWTIRAYQGALANFITPADTGTWKHRGPTRPRLFRPIARPASTTKKCWLHVCLFFWGIGPLEHRLTLLTRYRVGVHWGSDSEPLPGKMRWHSSGDHSSRPQPHPARLSPPILSLSTSCQPARFAALPPNRARSQCDELSPPLTERKLCVRLCRTIDLSPRVKHFPWLSWPWW
jgi:hypothetical protein